METVMLVLKKYMYQQIFVCDDVMMLDLYFFGKIGQYIFTTF